MKNADITASTLVQESLLRQEGTKVLQQAKIIECIEKHSLKYTFVGSYSSKTMVWPDIDICICLHYSQKHLIKEIVNDLFDRDNMVKIVIKDEYHKIEGNRGAFYIGAIYFYPETQRIWKIDIKGVPPEKYNIMLYKKKNISLMDERQRQLIIEAKKLYSEYVDGFFRPPKSVSHKIQELVLVNKCSSINEIKERLV